MTDLFDVGERMPKPKTTCTPAPIGTGPQGETCGTCQHAMKVQYHDYSYWKCGAAKESWTHGAGSDIRLKWLACREWKKKT